MKVTEASYREKIKVDRQSELYFIYLRKLIENKFTGKVTINFFNGGITNVNKIHEPVIVEEESVKLEP